MPGLTSWAKQAQKNQNERCEINGQDIRLSQHTLLHMNIHINYTHHSKGGTRSQDEVRIRDGWQRAISDCPSDRDNNNHGGKIIGVPLLRKSFREWQCEKDYTPRDLSGFTSLGGSGLLCRFIPVRCSDEHDTRNLRRELIKKETR